jgi:colanic acid/amylovoran biosynthesis glycosyltransferase
MAGAARFVSNLHKGPVPLLNSLNVLKYGKEAVSLKVLFQIAPFLSRGPYDVVHCQFGPNGILGSLLRDRGAFQAKVITTFRGYDASSYVASRGRHVYDELFKKGDLFLCVSKKIREKIIALGCPERKAIVHGSGVDTRQFSFIRRGPVGGRKVKLLTIARLVEKKGVEYGIRAVAHLVQKHPSVEYEIVGDGPLKGDLERLIEEMQVRHAIKLIGSKHREEIVELLGTADILLAPSVTSTHGDEEGIPGVLREGLARGLPVVSTQHSGIPELVQNGVSGFLVPERDVDSLAEKLEYLIQHQNVWAEMGQAGRKYVEEQYDINALNDRLVRLYAQLLDGQIPSRSSILCEAS